MEEVEAGVARLDALGRDAAERELFACCGSGEWAARMAAERPFRTLAALLEAASRIWRELPESEWLQTFGAHARIGDATVSGEGAREQSGMRSASRETLDGLTLANRHYEQRFGRVFLVCASGKTGEEMLAACLARLHNDPATELRICAEEQRKITALRLRKLAASA